MQAAGTRIAWIIAVLLSFFAGLVTGRLLWKTSGVLPDSFSGAQDAVPQGFSGGVEAMQVFTLGVAGSAALIVFLVVAIMIRHIQAGRRRRRDD